MQAQTTLMNKYLKAFLIFIGIIFLLFALVVSCFLWSMRAMQQRAEKDSIVMSEKCNQVNVTERPKITLSKFDKSEIEELRFYILRNNQIVKDTLIKNKLHDKHIEFHTNIPFNDFLKSDTIVVETKNKAYFKISGFSHYAYLHYGIFGYLDSHDCRFEDGKYTINGKENTGWLLKENGVYGNVALDSQSSWK